MSAGHKDSILHVVVVGFHHKKGCQVEYAYPSLVEGDQEHCNVPDEWKHLASLALPDGAHNYTSDTVYFHLPSRTDALSTVYGVSCYRQMDASKLLKKDSEVTRNTVQKSVCVVSTLNWKQQNSYLVETAQCEGMVEVEAARYEQTLPTPSPSIRPVKTAGTQRPLYGLIQAKLELITAVYFRECDFSQVTILEDAYHQLNTQLSQSMLGTSQVFLGLSCRDIVHKYKGKLLILLKLILLERRVLFYGSPAKNVCTELLSILSLFPELVEHGLKESAAYSPSKRVSPTLKNVRLGSQTSEDFMEVRFSEGDVPLNEEQSSSLPGESTGHVDNNKASVVQSSQQDTTLIPNDDDIAEIGDDTLEDPEGLSKSEDTIPDLLADVAKPLHEEKSASEEMDNMEDLLEADDSCVFQEDRLTLEIKSSVDSSPCHVNADADADDDDAEVGEKEDEQKLSPSHVAATKNKHLSRSDSRQSNTSQGSLSSVASDLSQVSVKAMTGLKSRITSIWPVSAAAATKIDVDAAANSAPKIELQDMRPTTPNSLVSDALGFPIPIFTKGVLCHPYLSLQYYDLLRDANVRGFVVGASNMLFKQKRHLLDVVIESTDDGEDILIDISDPELRKQLNLTTADLRFTETMVRIVTENTGDLFLDETEWEGGDEWIREQFRQYLVSFLATVNKQDEEHLPDFNLSFIQAWQSTRNYKSWKSIEHPGLDTFSSGHLYHGQIGMQDVRNKVAHSLNSSERGKKVAAAAANTGKAVMSTGKAVGGALATAKTAMSTSVTSLFGKLRHWTSTEEEEQPYLPSSQSQDSTQQTDQSEATTQKTDQSEALTQENNQTGESTQKQPECDSDNELQFEDSNNSFSDINLGSPENENNSKVAS